jgi:ABC-type sugar transport system substrate-binding protein
MVARNTGGRGASLRVVIRAFIAVILASTAVFAAACGGSDDDDSASTGASTGTAAADSTGGEAAGGKTFYWVQAPKGVPAHRIAQFGFLQGCKEQGMKCRVVGPDTGDVPLIVTALRQVQAQGDVAGLALWSGGLPEFKGPLEGFAELDVPIAIPHFKIDEGFYPGDVVGVSGDQQRGAADVAIAMCRALAGRRGQIAVTQNDKNVTENEYSKIFTETMQRECPDNEVLEPELEGVEPAKAVAKAVSIIQAHPDLVGALSTTGGGGTTWAGAQRQTNKRLVVFGTDYTPDNLALVASGEITGVLAQPLFEESRRAAELMKAKVDGREVPFWETLPEIVVTRENLARYEELNRQVEEYATGL